jgi:DNA-binding MarR family transcriptional regulator
MIEKRSKSPSSFDFSMSPPQLNLRHQSTVAPSAGAPDALGLSPGTVGDLLLRTAGRLTALLEAPTAQGGLNESRYNVLSVLRRKDAAGCSQSELAGDLLLSESNLSTLLERMQRDGLISRVRSDTDRRKSLIGLTAAGREAVAVAAHARARTTASMLRALGWERELTLGESLGLLVHRLECALGIKMSPQGPGR